jgi:hypothetical protein
MAEALTARFDLIVAGFSASHSIRTEMVRWLKENIPEVLVVVLLAHEHEDFPDANLTTLPESPVSWLTTVRKACAKNPD